MEDPINIKLTAENADLKGEIEMLKNEIDALQLTKSTDDLTASFFDAGTCPSIVEGKLLSIVVLGASGDLAKKKTFPALFKLFQVGLIPREVLVFGFARSPLTNEEFHEKVGERMKGDKADVDAFLKRCRYFHGQYTERESFVALDKFMQQYEGERAAGSNRIFYMAVPPSIFLASADSIKHGAMSRCGWNRIVVEKPFGHDLASSTALSENLARLFHEDQLYRIDHYLGKELVQNLIVLRFANMNFEPLWNKHYISNVQITFKEPIGLEGRAGYFDKFGIVRDVMQNHLLQIFSLVAMEPPISLSAGDVRDEKVKVLRCVPPITLSDTVIGQFVRGGQPEEPGYLEDPAVPDDSNTPTFATSVLHIKNSRWEGVPFILKCGKGLNERKAEIRVQFKPVASNLFPGVARNELVIRVQPEESIYMKVITKKPGLSVELVQSELDLSYSKRFDLKAGLPDAYERLIFDVVRGDQSQFVRVDELEAAWKIFTPLLHQIEADKSIRPIQYKFGTRGPIESDKLAAGYGFVRSDDYIWPGDSSKVEE
eukprot:TRINITY_DN8859_c0_g1_i1.p1 TRINITY_DN8859_c0_g1~~TRINITY_DN8859_c0_g1_i1.p1  ORF type:complete len:631 (+),score=121.35 TRINITY_DN8859_c0_g1_i1:270-1895(+)